MSSVDYYLHDGSKICFIIRRQFLLVSCTCDLQALQERNGSKKQHLLLKKTVLSVVVGGIREFVSFQPAKLQQGMLMLPQQLNRPPKIGLWMRL